MKAVFFSFGVYCCWTSVYFEYTIHDYFYGGVGWTLNETTEY